MRSASRDSRVAMVGASSLLGKEILNVLKERGFPASQVSELSAEGGAPEIPILDVEEKPLPLVKGESLEEDEYDFVFIASRAQSAEGKRWFHEHFEESAEAPAAGKGRTGRWVIDAAGCAPPSMKGWALSIPSLDPRQDNLVRAASEGSRFFASPHAAAIVISHLLLRLAASLSVQRAVVEVFNPASELGPEAIDELQKQTVSLLSFQQLPQDFFGVQTAFNMIPRLGGKGRENFLDLEERIRQEVKQILAGQAPAVRLVQSPAFYSLAFSFYVETAHGLTAAKVEQA
ncbi:MAG TPA: Asd/ArgC dimerization domain-containing protein, partial [Terriglobia bacterium]|nr:Asd/ArgC dimerization domain-containing protein [Terriglobia bacterium]